MKIIDSLFESHLRILVELFAVPKNIRIKSEFFNRIPDCRLQFVLGSLPGVTQIDFMMEMPPQVDVGLIS